MTNSPDNPANDEPEYRSVLDLDQEALQATGLAAHFYQEAQQVSRAIGIDRPRLALGQLRQDRPFEERFPVQSLLEGCRLLQAQDAQALGPALRNRLGQLAAAIGELVFAAELFGELEQELSSTPDEVIVLENLAVVYFQQNDFPSALATIRRLDANGRGISLQAHDLELALGSELSLMADDEISLDGDVAAVEQDFQLEDSTIRSAEDSLQLQDAADDEEDSSLEPLPAALPAAAPIPFPELTPFDDEPAPLAYSPPVSFSSEVKIEERLVDDDDELLDLDEPTDIIPQSESRPLVDGVVIEFSAQSGPVSRIADSSLNLDIDAVDESSLEELHIKMLSAAEALDFERAASLRDRITQLRQQFDPDTESPRVTKAEETPVYLDENVQFTVYRLRVVAPMKWYPLLAFAHLSERPIDSDEPDPVEEVQRQARQVLGEQAGQFQDVTQDSLLAVPKEGELTMVPEVPGVEFNPPRRSFVWRESVHREEFRLRAAQECVDQTVRGRLTVFLGSIILADVPLAIRVSEQAPADAHTDLTPQAARPYRKIFASYSHRDLPIVEQFERFAAAYGDEYLRDWKHLRAGQVWNDELMNMIRQADLFQLFWSTNSMRSTYVQQEWQYALSLSRPHFVRPTYWEDPLPSSPQEDLPPASLQRLHFQRVFLGSIASSPGQGGVIPSLPTLHSPIAELAPAQSPSLPSGDLPMRPQPTPDSPEQSAASVDDKEEDADHGCRGTRRYGYGGAYFGNRTENADRTRSSAPSSTSSCLGIVAILVLLTVAILLLMSWF